jgi:hypothetical protein
MLMYEGSKILQIVTTHQPTRRHTPKIGNHMELKTMQIAQVVRKVPAS